MKTVKFVLVTILIAMGFYAQAQQAQQIKEGQYYFDRYGNTLNGGIGLVHFGYIGRTLPALHLNYEFDVARNFTLAPFISYSGFKDFRYGGYPDLPYRDYYYKYTVVPVGIKGTYYFDELLNVGPRWDIYAGVSAGMNFQKKVRDAGYYGPRTVELDVNGMSLDLHLGAEYHINERIGVFADMSSGISTMGLAAHMW